MISSQVIPHKLGKHPLMRAVLQQTSVLQILLLRRAGSAGPGTIAPLVELQPSPSLTCPAQSTARAPADPELSRFGRVGLPFSQRVTGAGRWLPGARLVVRGAEPKGLCDCSPVAQVSWTLLPGQAEGSHQRAETEELWNHFLPVSAIDLSQ